MVRVAVVGATGYAGAELVRILAGHSEVELTVLTSRQYAGVRFDAVYPSMSGWVDLTCQPLALDDICEQAEVVFLALPHKLPMEIVPHLLQRRKKVVDLSADFRFKDVGRYESVYQPHCAKALISRSVYGLCEIYRDQICRADLVGNPGCYPTSVLLPLIPLVRQGLLEPDGIVADSKSGVSGAGRSTNLSSHFCEANESFRAYKVAAHRHAPEMEEVLGRESGHELHLTFVPHLIPMTRGMLSTVYAHLAPNVSAGDVCDCLRTFYAGQPFVRICEGQRLPDTKHVNGTNCCDIGCRVDSANNRLVLIAAIDNLVKGAAGQAVQNMNIMLGIDETKGLRTVPGPL